MNKSSLATASDWWKIQLPCLKCYYDDKVYINTGDEMSCACERCGHTFVALDVVDQDDLDEMLDEINFELLGTYEDDEDADVSFTAEFNGEFNAANKAADKLLQSDNNDMSKSWNRDAKQFFEDNVKRMQQEATQLESAKNRPNNFNTEKDDKGWSTNTSIGGFKTLACFHEPTKVIHGEGWEICAGKRMDVMDRAHEFDIVMNLTYRSIKSDKHIIPIPELERWQTHGHDYVEMQMNWPDYGVVELPRQFWVELLQHVEKNKKRMVVFCEGGHGRTGTAVATMLVVGCGMLPQDAISWVRREYCNRAIESKGQEMYIFRMYNEAIGDPKMKLYWGDFYDKKVVPAPETVKHLSKKERKKLKKKDRLLATGAW